MSNREKVPKVLIVVLDIIGDWRRHQMAPKEEEEEEGKAEDESAIAAPKQEKQSYLVRDDKYWEE